MKTVISFRLRKELDSDLLALQVDEKELADLCRNGLRYMLGIRTKKAVQIVEQPIKPQSIKVPVKSSPAKVFYGGGQRVKS